MESLTLTARQARRCLLAHQGLWPPYELAGKAGVLDYIRRVGCIQFDPLDIVSRNPELLLQARVADFSPAMLQELLYEERKLLDGWDKNLSIYRVEDWPCFQRHRETVAHSHGSSAASVQAILPQVREALQERGPLSSADLHLDQTVDWWWAPTRLARAALESMYFWGELIIHHKVGTRKVYDLAQRHLPPELLSARDPNETEEQYHDWYVLRRIGSVGLLWDRSGDAWLGISGMKSKERQAALTRLLARGKLVEVRVEGIEQAFYLRSEDRPCLDRALDSDDPAPRASILAPLDNLLWDRRLVNALFGFDYRWEVYKPLGERRYGYYVLPVLYGDRFVARFEPGRDRKNGAVRIKQWWWEPGVTPSQGMQSDLLGCFRRFLGFLGADYLQIDGETAERAGLGWLVSAG